MGRLAQQLAARSLLDGRKRRYELHPIVRDYACTLLPDPSAHHRAAAVYFRSQYTASHPNAHTHPAKDIADVQPLLDAVYHLIAAGEYEQFSDVLYFTPVEYMSEGGNVDLHGLLFRWREFSRLQTILDLLAAPSYRARWSPSRRAGQPLYCLS